MSLEGEITRDEPQGSEHREISLETLRSALIEIRQTVSRVQADDTLREKFLKALESTEQNLTDVSLDQIRKAPNDKSAVVLGALMFLAAEHGGSKTVVKAKDAFAKHFPEVSRDVWLGVQKAAH